MSDLHPTYIGQIERGEKNPSIESIYKISQALKIPLAVLLEKIDEYDIPSDDYSLYYKQKPNDNIPLKIYELISLEPQKNQEYLYNILIYALKLKKTDKRLPKDSLLSNIYYIFLLHSILHALNILSNIRNGILAIFCYYLNYRTSYNNTISHRGHLLSLLRS